MFSTLPVAFSQLPLGIVWGSIFFILLLFAAWTSAISILEPIVAYISEKSRFSRLKAATFAGVFIWLLGILTVMSFNKWAFSFSFLGQEKTAGFFDIFDLLTTNFLLPLGGVLIALFAGWAMERKFSSKELDLEKSQYGFWLFLVRFVSPMAVLLVLIYSLLS